MTKTSQTDGENLIATVEGDGGAAEVTKQELTAFHEEIDLIVKSAAYGVTERRQASEDTRYCRWVGQSPDGRKHSEAHHGEPVFPYEGASDARIRIADQIVNERVLVLVAATLRALGSPHVQGLNFDDKEKAPPFGAILRWLVKNQWGSKFLREMTKLAQYQEGDSPAGGVLGVFWQQEVALQMQTLTKEGLAQLLVQTFGLNQEQLGQLEANLMNPDLDAETAALLMAITPDLKEARAKAVLRDLRETGEAAFPAPYMRINLPTMVAYRLFEDIFFPANTTELTERARCIFVREWLSKPEVLERSVTHGYSEEFCEKLLEHEGETGFPLIFNRPEGITGDFSGQIIRQSYNPEIYRGLYEVITVFFKAANEDKIPGIYTLPFSKCVAEVAAKERELLDYAHGKYPFIFFGREALTQRLWDSRGVPELVMTDQNALKLLLDAGNDNVSLTTVPPVLVPRRRGNLGLTIGPLKLIKVDRPGEIAYLQGPQMPAGAGQMAASVQARLDQYWGRIAQDVPPTLTQLHQGGLVNSFLANLTDAFVMVLQLCQQYMEDEDVQQITGDDGMQLMHTAKEIQGKFHLELSFDPRDLDVDYIVKLAQVIGEVILPIDTLSTVQRDKLVQRLFSALEPRLAAETLRPVQSAQQDEIKDEMGNFAQIAAGAEPPMAASGQNFGLRLQVLQGIVQKNPDALRALQPASRKILQARVAQLQAQVQQIQNAVIGRQVGKPALGGPPLGTPGAPPPGAEGAQGMSGMEQQQQQQQG